VVVRLMGKPVGGPYQFRLYPKSAPSALLDLRREAAMPEDSSPEQTEQTLSTILHFHATFNTHDVDAIMQLMSEDCVFETTFPAPDGTRFVGQAAVREAWDNLFRDSPQAVFVIEEVFAAGNRGVVRWCYSWDTSPDVKGHVRGVDILRIHAGKVSEKLSYVKG
jgi:ketosteroid isomerase-like protein